METKLKIMEAVVDQIKVRNVDFKFDEVSKHWVLNNPILTHFINSMNIVFPEGERFFIRSVRKYSKLAKDPQLKRDIRGFCGQEGIHAREHEKFWEVMEDQGLEPYKFATFLNKTAFGGEYALEKLIVKGLNAISPDLGDKMTLSLTAALEHYTAMIANAVFHEPIATNDNMAPQMLELLHWHAAEEIEHKAVSYDLLQVVDDNYYLRISGMGLATIALWGYLGLGQLYFISKDEDVSIVKIPAQAYEFFTTIVLGEIGKGIARNFFSYFKRDFHPKDIDDSYLAEEFFSDKAYA